MSRSNVEITVTSENLSNVQSSSSQPPVTLQSANVINPITKLSFITGTEQIEYINPPINAYHEITLIFLDTYLGATFLFTGNIVSGPAFPFNCTMALNTSVTFAFNPISQRYYPISLTS